MARVVTIRFRYPLKIFQKYQLYSRAIYWDNEWVWTEHHFERNGRTIAIGLTKVAFTGPQGMVPIEKIVDAGGQAIISPEIPEFVTELLHIEEQIRARQK